MFLSSLSFTSPLLLVALAGLPVLWWLLRIMPPRANHVTFPPIAFLMALTNKEDTPHHTPLWLLILRVFIAALVIIGLSGPILNPPPELTGEGPLVLVIDDGWASASSWTGRQNILNQTIDQAGRDKRPLALITTAPGPGQQLASSLLSAPEAKQELMKLQPRAWATDRKQTAGRLASEGFAGLAGNPADFIWLSDGLADGGSADLLRKLQQHGRVLHTVTDALAAPLALMPPLRQGSTFSVDVRRAQASNIRVGRISAIDERGRSLASAEFEFAATDTSATASFTLPLELQNTIARIEIDGQRSAAAIQLIDERWKRRTVGITTAGTGDIDKPLLSDIFYLGRALAPFAEARRGDLEDLSSQSLSALILPDIGQIPAAELQQVTNWIESGGLLLRFAGPRLATRQDALVPVPLRRGGRALGGALSWETPQHLGAFDEKSPYFGLTIPGDVTVSKQVLAEPSIELASHTWARLTDGTPLVTARRLGEGWIVLFHITANPDWSTLPMSGLFVEMLERTIAWSRAGAINPATDTSDLESRLYLDKRITGYGDLVKPGQTFEPVAIKDLTAWVPGPAQPPGIYQRPAMVRALNLIDQDTDISPLADLPASVGSLNLGNQIAQDLKALCLTLALLLAFIDGLALLLIGASPGRLRRLIPFGATNVLVAAVAAMLLTPSDARADAAEAEALRATLQTHLAYIITGDEATDRMSKAGLKGLSDVLGARTAVEPGAPLGVNLETDELAFFPLIYWPVSADHKTVSPAALTKLNRYMRTGGTVVFDTRDQEMQFSSLTGTGATTANSRRLKEILDQLDIPPLSQVPDDHVLTKSFYLMREFPGRWAGGKVWVEAIDADGSASRNNGGSLNDGVSSIVIGANDWAAAWAVDMRGRPMAATVPGSTRQRELAYRFGINLTMYTLTGNYKADQVHIPALLERLGE